VNRTSMYYGLMDYPCWAYYYVNAYLGGNIFSCILMELLKKLAEKPGIALFLPLVRSIVFLNVATIFDLTIGLLLCLISLLKVQVIVYHCFFGLEHVNSRS
jgi:hypothetical protein